MNKYTSIRMKDEKCKACGRSLGSHSMQELADCGSRMIGFTKLVFKP